MPIRDKNPQLLRRVVILTALPAELRAVHAHLKDVRRVRIPGGTIYEQGLFAAEEGTWEVLLVAARPNDLRAAIEAERAIQHFSPSVALVVGVAGGMEDNVRIGDVVVASRVIEYESAVGKDSDALEQRALAVARDGAWLRRIPGGVMSEAPRVVVSPVTTEKSVVPDTHSAFRQDVHPHYGHAVTAEMDGLGFLGDARAIRSGHILAIRGISDHIADLQSDTDASGSLELASRHASAFAFAVLAGFQPSEPGAPLTAVDKRLTELAALKAGWLDGENGEPLSKTGLEWLRSLLNKAMSRHKLPMPLLTPMEDGGVSASWHFQPWYVSADFDLSQMSAYLHAAQVATKEVHDAEVSFVREEEALTRLAAFVLQYEPEDEGASV